MVPKLRFKEFINPWSEFLLGDLSNLSRGKFSVRPRNDPKYFGGNMPFIQTGDIVKSGVYVEQYTQTLNELGVAVSKVFPPETIMITIAANIGDLAILKYPMACPDSLVGIEAKKNISNNLWLMYALSLKKDELDANATQNAQKNINLQVLNALNISAPLLSEQTKIADFLSSVDKKISLLSKQYELLYQYKKGMMQKIFSQELRFRDENGEGFPDWEKCKLRNFLIPTLREVKKPNENFLSVGIRSHFKGTFHKEDQDPNKVAVETLYLVHDGDFILNITFAWEGALAIVRKEDHLGYVSHRFPTYTFKNDIIINDFFRYIYTQPKFLTYLDICSPGGAGRNRVLKKSEFLDIEIDRPCLEEQTKIANFLSAIDDKITTKKVELDKLKTWKQGLLQQMFV